MTVNSNSYLHPQAAVTNWPNAAEEQHSEQNRREPYR